MLVGVTKGLSRFPTQYAPRGELPIQAPLKRRGTGRLPATPRRPSPRFYCRPQGRAANRLVLCAGRLSYPVGSSRRLDRRRLGECDCTGPAANYPNLIGPCPLLAPFGFSTP